MSLVIDASVAIKWAVQEHDSDRALALIVAEPIAAPDFLLLECANVLAMKVRRGMTTREFAALSLQTIQGSALRLVPAVAHFGRALAIATELEQSAYDSLYLAMALAEGATLVTADGRFARAAQASPTYAAHVRLL